MPHRNGVAVALPVEPAETKPGTVSGFSTPTEIERSIGEATASAVEALIVALIDSEGGAPMRPEIKALNGEKLAVVVELWLAHLGEVDDWRGLALAAGRSAILERHGEALRQQIGAGVSDAAIAGCIDELCGWVVTVAGQVAAIEAAYRSN
jgi:hypothetical protein